MTIRAALFSLKSDLDKISDIRVKEWKVESPATESEIEAFKAEVGGIWPEIPNSLLEVYREVNGISIAWEHHTGLTGGISLLPLKDIKSYDQYFDSPQPMGERVNFFVLDLYSPEMVAGVYFDQEEGTVEDSILLKSVKDEDGHGDDTDLDLVGYLLGVIKGWGLHYDGRLYLWDDYHFEDKHDFEAEPFTWPFATFADYLENTDPEQRLAKGIEFYLPEWIAEIQTQGYKLDSVNDRFEKNDWELLPAEEVIKIQVDCGALNEFHTEVFSLFPNLEKLHLYELNPETDLGGLETVHQLSELMLDYPELQPALSHIASVEFPKVEVLIIGGNGKHSDWAFLNQFPRLKELRLWRRLLASGESIPGYRGKGKKYFRI